jgi:hypothetical protein
MQNPRQLYGLGSLVKSITKPFKSVARGVKKFAKSDLGKAALLATAGAYGFGMGPFSASGMFSSAPGRGFLSNMLGKKFTSDAFMKGLGKIGDRALDVGVGSIIGGGLDALQRSKLPEEETRIMGRTEEELDEIESELRQTYENLGYSAGEIDLLVEQGMKEYGRDMNAYGGRIGYAMGTPEENAIQAAGIEGLPLNQNPAGVTELDLRETGGFIPPVGVKEKADDIPAMLSNNEFVFTADAVKEFGDGDVNKGAERMYAMMKQLENGGRV